MKSNPGASNMKTILAVFQLVGMASVAFCTSTGRFAVLRRHNSFAKGTFASSLLYFRRRSSRQDCDHSNYNGDVENLKYDNNHNISFHSDDRIFQDSASEFTGRFAMEYELERNMIRSAENAHIRRQQTTNEYNAGETIDSAYRIKPAATCRSEGTEYELRQRRCASSHQNNDPIFV